MTEEYVFTKIVKEFTYIEADSQEEAWNIFRDGKVKPTDFDQIDEVSCKEAVTNSWCPYLG